MAEKACLPVGKFFELVPGSWDVFVKASKKGW